MPTANTVDFKEILESIDEYILSFDRNWNILFISKSSADDFGSKPSQLVGKNFWETFPRLIGTELEKNYREAMEKKEVRYFEWRTIYAKERIEEFTVSPSAQGVTVYGRDITKRRQAEQTLQLSNQRMNEILSNMKDYFYSIDSNWNFRYLDASVASLIGKKPEELIGKNAWESYPKLLGSPFEINLRTAMERREVTRFEMQGIYANKLYTVTVYPVDNGIVVSGIDITERKRAEEAVRRQANLIDLSPDAILVRELDGTITFWGKGAQKLYGYTKEEAVGQKSHLLLKTVFPIPLEDIIAQLERTGKWQGELTHKTKTNQEVIVQSRWRVEKSGHQQLSILESNIDITERKRAEEAVKRQADLIDLSPDAILVRDSDGTITFWGKGAQKLYGYTRAEALGQKSHFLLKTVFPVPLEDIIVQLEKTGKWQGELTHKTKTAQEVLVQSRWRVEKSGRQQLSILESNIDITERRKAEKALLKATEQTELDRKRLETILETSPSAVVIIEAADGKFSFVNKRAMELYGFDTLGLDLKENVVKVKARRADGTDYPIEEMPVSRSLRLGREVHNEEMIIENAKGRSFPIMASTAPLRNLRGDITAAIVVWEDITDRKKAEDALRESERRWATTVACIGDAILTTDASGNVTFMNAVAESLTGWSLEEAYMKPAKKVFKIINEFTRGTVEDPIAKVVENGVIIGLANHTILVRKDGTEVPIDDSAAPIITDEGQFTGVVLVFRNITERRKAESALRESEIKFKTMADFTYDWEYWLSPEGNIVYMSPSCEKYTGYAPEEFQTDPKLLGKIVHELDKGLFDSHFILTSTDPKHEVDFRIDTRTGGLRWVSHVCQPVFDNEGNWIGRRISNRDITERKKAEDTLYNLNRHLRALSDSNQALMHATDEPSLLQEVCDILNRCGYTLVNIGLAENDPKKTVRVVAFSGFDEKYINSIQASWDEKSKRGRGPAGMVIRTGKPYITDTHTDVNFAPWRREALKRGYTTQLVLPLTSFEGRTFGVIGIYCQETNPFTDEEVKLLSELSNDLSYGIMMLRLRKERAQAEEALRQRTEQLEQTQKKLEENAIQLEEYANQMEELARQRAKQLQDAERLAAIGQTAGMVGHDIRNPLQAISGDLYLLNGNMADFPDGDVKNEMIESVESIAANIGYINKIVADLQDYARPLNPEYSVFDLPSLIQETMKTITFPRNVILSVKIETVQTIKSDQTYVRRFITNLVNNAIQALPNGGNVEVSCFVKDGGIFITVSDNGVGIAEDFKSKLFTPMMTTKAKGQGLGLAVVKRLVEAMQGTICFESEKGKGTKFIVQLPKQ